MGHLLTPNQHILYNFASSQKIWVLYIMNQVGLLDHEFLPYTWSTIVMSACLWDIGCIPGTEFTITFSIGSIVLGIYELGSFQAPLTPLTGFQTKGACASHY